MTTMTFRLFTTIGMSKMFREGTCPKCHEKIQVPDDRDKIICMYCGQEIAVEEALGEKKEIDYVAYGENYNKAMKGLQDVIEKCSNPMKDFRKDKYEKIFEEFYGENRSVFESIEYVYRNDENPEGWLQKLAARFVETAKTDLNGHGSKSKRNQRLLDLNLMLSVYLIPAMMKYPASFSEPFSDCLLENWNREFDTRVGKASFSDIDNGFHKKLCYITTAVCDSLGKGADCYELKLLKNYRDHYLELTPEGHEMVEEYYDIAPTIVKRIEKQEDKDKVYRELYQSYIMPCIQEIERQEYELCRARYQDMVLELKSRYMN